MVLEDDRAARLNYDWAAALNDDCAAALDDDRAVVPEDGSEISGVPREALRVGNSVSNRRGLKGRT